MNKSLILRFEDTPEMREVLGRVAGGGRLTPYAPQEIRDAMQKVRQTIADALSIPPEPVDPPKFDGGGDQP